MSVQLWIKRSGAPPRHRERQINHDWNRQWGIAGDEMLACLGLGCTWLLCGPRGTGKTQLAVELIGGACKLCKPRADVLASDTHPATYATAVRMLEDMREALTDKGSPAKVRKLYRLASLLVLDELQEYEQNPWRDYTLTGLVDERYGKGLDTVLITNLEPDAAAKRLGSSIMRRVEETGGVIECDWGRYQDRKENDNEAKDD